MITPAQQADYAIRPIRWGIAGTGAIAGQFAGDMPLLDEGTIHAVGSRAMATADKFADRFDIPNRHASYADLVADPEVDAVYVSSPHPMHRDNALQAIEAGKHVLVEKPITLNASQARELASAASEHGVFLMEAMWTRFLPHIIDVRQVLASGALGDVRMVQASHGYYMAEDANSRLFAPELGGGALLDLGIYPVSFASMVFGRPSDITAVSAPAFTGVDAQTSIICEYAGGRQAVLVTSLQGQLSNTVTIVGTEARIEIDSGAYSPSSFSVITRDGETTRHGHVEPGQGLRYQAGEVARCLRAGLLESPVMPLDESVRIMETMDEVRRQIGLVYPQER